MQINMERQGPPQSTLPVSRHGLPVLFWLAIFTIVWNFTLPCQATDLAYADPGQPPKLTTNNGQSDTSPSGAANTTSQSYTGSVSRAARAQGFGLHSLNPFDAVTRPIDQMQKSLNDLQDQTVRLEQEMGRISNPMSQLPGSIRHLEEQTNSLNKNAKDMTSAVNGVRQELTGAVDNMTSLNHGVSDVGGAIRGVRGDLVKTWSSIADVRGELASLHSEVRSVQTQLRQDVNELESIHSVLKDIRDDLRSTGDTISGIKEPISDLKGPINKIEEPLVGIEKPINRVDMRLIGLNNQLAELHDLLRIILLAIFGFVAVIAVTVVAFCFSWVSRRRIVTIDRPDSKIL